MASAGAPETRSPGADGPGPGSGAHEPGEPGSRGGAPSSSSASPSFAQLLLSLAHDLPGLISDRVHLAALELRRARQSLVRMLAMIVVAAILAATAWFALWALIVVILLALGVPWVGAFALVLVVNGAGVWFAIARARALVEDLTLPATVRRLTFAPSPLPDPAQDATHVAPVFDPGTPPAAGAAARSGEARP